MQVCQASVEKKLQLRAFRSDFEVSVEVGEMKRPERVDGCNCKCYVLQLRFSLIISTSLSMLTNQVEYHLDTPHSAVVTIQYSPFH